MIDFLYTKKYRVLFKYFVLRYLNTMYDVVVLYIFEYLCKIRICIKNMRNALRHMCFEHKKEILKILVLVKILSYSI